MEPRGCAADGYWTRPEETFARSFEALVLLDVGEIKGFQYHKEWLPQGSEAKALAAVVRPIYRKVVRGA